MVGCSVSLLQTWLSCPEASPPQRLSRNMVRAVRPQRRADTAAIAPCYLSKGSRVRTCYSACTVFDHRLLRARLCPGIYIRSWNQDPGEPDGAEIVVSLSCAHTVHLPLGRVRTGPLNKGAPQIKFLTDGFPPVGAHRDLCGGNHQG